MGRCTDLIYSVLIWPHKSYNLLKGYVLLWWWFSLVWFCCNRGDLLSVTLAKTDKSYFVSCCFIASEYSEWWEWWNLLCACSHSELWYGSKAEKVCRGNIFIKTEFWFYTLKIQFEFVCKERTVEFSRWLWSWLAYWTSLWF